MLPSFSIDFVSVASNLPEGLLQNIWDKASILVNTKGAMAPAPGYPPEPKTVESTFFFILSSQVQAAGLPVIMQTIIH